MNFNRLCFRLYVERCYLKSAMPRHPSGYFYIETMAEKDAHRISVPNSILVYKK